MENLIPKLSNRFYHARFDPNTGGLSELLPADDKVSLVRRLFISYQAEGLLYSENHANPLALGPEVVSVRCSRNEISSVLRTPQLEIRRSFRMTPGSPLLSVRYEFIAATTARLHGPGLLYLELAPDVNDVTRDEKDMYFDGAELGRRMELPCWRVLYRKGHRRGVLVAARSKWQMSHLMYDAQTIEFRPHVYAQQQVDYDARDIPVDIRPGESHVIEFEFGPWWSDRHKSLIQAAALNMPVTVSTAPTPRTPTKATRPGKVLWATDWAPTSSVSDVFHSRKWLRLRLPWNTGRKVLVCNAGCRPPDFTINPIIRGPCRVFVGCSRSASLGLQFSGDPYPIYRLGLGGTAFHSVLYGTGQVAELYYGVVELSGRTIRIVPNYNGHWPTRFDYLRLEPLPPAEAEAWMRQQATPNRTLMAGIPDCGDVFFNLLDQDTLDTRIVEGNIWEQARVGFTRLYWQMHGSYTHFHTRIGTQTPMVCKAHCAFEPQAKAGVLFERKHDLLRVAIEACKKIGVDLWGASRMNSYMSGKRDDFFNNNLHMAEITESSKTCENKICYAFQEVRDYQRSILVEAAKYGLPGIMLGILRHPPILLYHPLLVSGYRARYGKLPPRDLGARDPFHLNSLPESGPEHLSWYAYRAEFMTQFGRELKRDLRNNGLGHVKISLWLRANHCLFDGINVEDWLKEGLCDEIVADIYCDKKLDEPRPKWRKMVLEHVPLLKGIGFGTYLDVARDPTRYLDQGYTGICSYGSEQFAQTPQALAFLDLLKNRTRKRKV